MSYWLLKTEPGEYTFDDLVREGKTVWDGVTNNWALTFVRKMQKGDQALIYHSGKEKQIVGISKITSGSYPDPIHQNQKRAVVDIIPARRLDSPVRLKILKDDPFFEEMFLVRFSRLSVMPVEKKHWHRIIKLSQI